MICFSTPGSTNFVEPLESRMFLSANLQIESAPPLTPFTLSAHNAMVRHVPRGHVDQRVAANPFNLTGAGTVLTFKKKKSLPGNGIAGFVSESGTFTDNKGHTGTYTLTLPPVLSTIQPPQLLDLAFKTKGSFAGGGRRYNLTFTPAGKRLSKGLNGKSLTFVTKAAGTAAKGIQDGTLAVIYLKY